MPALVPQRVLGVHIRYRIVRNQDAKNNKPVPRSGAHSLSFVPFTTEFDPCFSYGSDCRFEDYQRTRFTIPQYCFFRGCFKTALYQLFILQLIFLNYLFRFVSSWETQTGLWIQFILHVLLLTVKIEAYWDERAWAPTR